MRRYLMTLLLALTTAAMAQQGPKLEPLPEPPAPPPGMMDDGFEPDVTIMKRGDDTVEEYRVKGRLYMVKVTPPHGVPYYLVDTKGDGVMVRQGASTNLSVPMWVLKSW